MRILSRSSRGSVRKLVGLLKMELAVEKVGSEKRIISGTPLTLACPLSKRILDHAVWLQDVSKWRNG